MQVMIMLYKLKEGVDPESYKKFSLEVDQPLVNSFDTVEEFNVHFVMGPKKIWDLFEVIKVRSYKDWENITKQEIMKNHEKAWLKYVDENSVKLIYGEKI